MDNLFDFFDDIETEIPNNHPANNEEILNLDRKNENESRNQLLDDLMEIIHEDEKRSEKEEETLCSDPNDEYLKKTNWEINQPILDCSHDNSLIEENFNDFQGNNYGTGYQEFLNPIYVPTPKPGPENDQILSGDFQNHFQDNNYGTGYQEFQNPIYVPPPRDFQNHFQDNNYGTGYQEFRNPIYVPPPRDFQSQSPQNYIQTWPQNIRNNEVFETGNAWNLCQGSPENSNVFQENGKIIYVLQPKIEVDQNNLNSDLQNLALTSPILPDILLTPITIKSEFSPKPRRTRAKKEEMEKLSPIERIARRRRNARKNTANYNKRNKQEKDELSEKLEKNQEDLRKVKKSCKNKLSNFNNCKNFIFKYQPQNPNQQYFNPENIFNLENQIRIIETEKDENIRRIGNNENIQKLENDFKNLEKIYDFADKNMELKERNQNTYGSTKSRAKSEMEKSGMKLKLMKTQVEIEILTDFNMRLKEIKGFYYTVFDDYMKIKKINLQEKFGMTKPDFDKFERILAFFQLSDPL